MTELEPQFLETVDISALELRSAFSGLQAGVMGSGDLKVTAGTAGLTVDVAAGVAFVQGGQVSDQGLYRVRNDAVVNSAAFNAGGITANSSGLPRIDQIIARVQDQTHDASGQRRWRLEVLTGAPTAGATLDNRSGAAALPASSLRLADVLIPTGAATVAAGNIRDRRPWARGGYARVTSNATQTTAATSPTEISTALRVRLEVSPNSTIRAAFRGKLSNNTAGAVVVVHHREDGNNVNRTDSFTVGGIGFAAGYAVSGEVVWDWEPIGGAGSRLFSPWWRVSSGLATLVGGTSEDYQFTVQEIPLRAALNG